MTFLEDDAEERTWLSSSPVSQFLAEGFQINKSLKPKYVARIKFLLGREILRVHRMWKNPDPPFATHIPRAPISGNASLVMVVKF